ncbi:MAG TPA: MYXO-CTERM sorting domain-containing protein [Sandaracinaceae bacterium LLY-WYZ-13_1]|nr:MYXO-CTERM sorting domain-containing protein [Sandaracinaceae bacterium LLY-WYZ-13_1]
MTHTLRSLIAVAALLVPSPGRAQLPAFPGAQGFGAAATGGRGGEVLHVTTLAASGEGSLAWAAAQPGARYVVFDVAGVIEGDVEIAHSDITIAGQTAPGAGITLHGHLSTPYGSEVGNIVVRHVRIRPPGADDDWPAAQHDAIQMSTAHLLLFDHVDASHGIDEIVDLWGGARDITFQWSAITFPNPDGGHPEGAHPYGLINGPDGGRISIHHTLFAHVRVRTPALAEGPAEVLSNVVYDGREGFVHHNPANGDFVIAGNVYRDGPSASLAPFWFDPENGPDAPTRYFMGDNRVDDPGVFEGIVDDPYTTSGFDDAYVFACCGIEADQFHPLADRPDWSGEAGYVPVTRDAPADAFDDVLDCAGAWPRDFVTTTAVQETRDRDGTLRALPLDDLLAGLSPGAAPTDSDRDGMPDAWESARGLDPSSDDHLEPSDGGYPALEVYLNELADGLTPCGTGPVPPAPDGGTPGLDAGMPATGDAGPGTDAGPSAEDDGGGPGGEDGGAARDAGADEPGDGGCGCRAVRSDTPGGGWLLALAAAAWLGRRRFGDPRRR